MPETLLEDVGPNGNIQAVVEAHDDVCYFYLFGAKETEFGIRSVWVRNLAPADDAFDIERLREGEPVKNPRANCYHPQGLPAPKPEHLRVVWLPEGNGAALYENDQLLAIIPPWSGVRGFDGYARDNIGEGPLAWELRPENVLINGFREAEAYWKLWDEPGLWASISKPLLASIEKTLGVHSNYYAIDGGNWPPKAMVRIPRKDSVVLVTLGMCLRPQPNVETTTEHPESPRRIELGAVLPKRWSDDAIKEFGRYISAQSNLPWSYYTFLGPGHTIPCDSWQNREFSSALLQTSHPAVPTPALPPQFGDPVNILWFTPISEAEVQMAMDQSSDRLVQTLPKRRWEQA